jgi:hypothetical protein
VVGQRRQSLPGSSYFGFHATKRDLNCVRSDGIRQTITAASNITATRTIAVSADPSPPSGFHPVSFSIQSMAVTPTPRQD